MLIVLYLIEQYFIFSSSKFILHALPLLVIYVAQVTEIINLIVEYNTGWIHVINDHVESLVIFIHKILRLTDPAVRLQGRTRGDRIVA